MWKNIYLLFPILFYMKKSESTSQSNYDKHLVSTDSPFHGQNKWGYILVDSFRCKPELITSRGIISRKIA